MKTIIVLTNNKDIHRYLTAKNINCVDGLEKINFRLKPVVVMFSFGKLISKELLQKTAFYNVHNSLLPKYRGLHAFTWAIINGEKEVGYTLHKVTEGIDNGPIASQLKISISPSDDINAVFTKANKMVLPWFEKEIIKLSKLGLAKLKPQDESEATFVCKRKPEDGLIDWSKSARELVNFTRALTPPYTPGAFCVHKSQKVIIPRAENYPTPNYKGIEGQIVARVPNKGVLIKCGDGVVLVRDVISNDKKINSLELFKTVGARL